MIAREGDALNNKLTLGLGGLSFSEDVAGNIYVVGADSVPKKLGSEYECPTSTLRVTAFKTSVNDRLLILTFGKNIKITSSMDNDKTYWKFLGIKAEKQYNQTPAVMNIPQGDTLSINDSRIIVDSCEYPAVEVYRNVTTANAAAISYIDIEWV